MFCSTTKASTRLMLLMTRSVIELCQSWCWILSTKNGEGIGMRQESKWPSGSRILDHFCKVWSRSYLRNVLWIIHWWRTWQPLIRDRWLTQRNRTITRAIWDACWLSWLRMSDLMYKMLTTSSDSTPCLSTLLQLSGQRNLQYLIRLRSELMHF